MGLFEHKKRHGAGCRADAARPTTQALAECLAFESERIDMVEKTVADAVDAFEGYRAKMEARVGQLEAAAATANQNGATIPPGVQSQIEALVAEIKADTASDGNEPAPEPAPSGTDNEPSGSGPSAGDEGLPTPVTEPTA